MIETLGLTIMGLELSATYWWLLGLAIAFGFYMAWNIGANDVANAMGTSVGSGALTLKSAVIIAGILEVAGALFAGSHVADTMRDGIVSLQSFEGQPLMLACGMLAALLAAGVWLQVASYFGWPVSTTHSIVGAIVGFGAAYGGLEAVNWFGPKGVSSIAASWVISPLMSGAIAFVIFRILRRQILFSPRPVAAARLWTPWITLTVVTIMMLVLLFKGLQNVGLDKLPWYGTWGLALGVGLVGYLVSLFLVSRFKDSSADVGAAPVNDYYLTMTLGKAAKQLNRAAKVANGEAADRLNRMLDEVRHLAPAKKPEELSATNIEYQRVEKLFVYLQILTACFVAFAHGANDVANAIGPMSVVIQTVKAGAIPAKAAVPTWALLIGGVGIVVGLATWGWRVIETVGRRITELSPSRGFSAEFATALTVLLASKLGLPISTTHTLVGAVMGVGLARGISALNLNAIRDILISWIITLPAGAGMAIVFFYALRAIFI